MCSEMLAPNNKRKGERNRKRERRGFLGKRKNKLYMGFSCCTSTMDDYLDRSRLVLPLRTGFVPSAVDGQRAFSFGTATKVFPLNVRIVEAFLHTKNALRKLLLK